uniref:Uncharacterized protein n=1 Tax=Nelumbo nucifera TaxID=4432 RepID=A0A822Z2Y5_NELNU|nr:TPA_asm: hypothetical protein HUJ06_008702 [Nelumbo nucifera]
MINCANKHAWTPRQVSLLHSIDIDKYDSQASTSHKASNVYRIDDARKHAWTPRQVSLL